MSTIQEIFDNGEEVLKKDLEYKYKDKNRFGPPEILTKKYGKYIYYFLAIIIILLLVSMHLFVPFSSSYNTLISFFQTIIACQITALAFLMAFVIFGAELISKSSSPRFINILFEDEIFAIKVIFFGICIFIECIIFSTISNMDSGFFLPILNFKCSFSLSFFNNLNLVLNWNMIVLNILLKNVTLYRIYYILLYILLLISTYFYILILMEIISSAHSKIRTDNLVLKLFYDFQRNYKNYENLTEEKCKKFLHNNKLNENLIEENYKKCVHKNESNEKGDGLYGTIYQMIFEQINTSIKNYDVFSVRETIDKFYYFFKCFIFEKYYSDIFPITDKESNCSKFITKILLDLIKEIVREFQNSIQCAYNEKQGFIIYYLTEKFLDIFCFKIIKDSIQKNNENTDSVKNIFLLMNIIFFESIITLIQTNNYYYAEKLLKKYKKINVNPSKLQDFLGFIRNKDQYIDEIQSLCDYVDNCIDLLPKDGFSKMKDDLREILEILYDP